jgi:16S rRNA (uracil1498-N3)-methyltransferase
MKQSLRAYLPKINDMINFQDFINNCNNLEKYVGYLKDDNVKLLSNVSKSGNNYCVLIGPEGDFTLEEIDDALDSGFQCISLGKSRLRTETAGMVACHALNILNQ